MKKWLIACLLAIALLFVTTAAMAGHTKKNGEYCLGGSYGLLKEYENQHLRRCNDCQEELLENHWVGQEATCIRKAKCGDCTYRFGDYGPHDWGEWKSIGRGAHTRTCKHKSDHVETENCTFSVAPCDDYSPCTKCGAYSKLGHDWGGWTPNGDQTHTRVCTRDSSHTDTKDCTDFWDADCTTPAMCMVCWGTHGETAPDKHSWDRPSPNYDGTHTYTCRDNPSHTKKEACTTSGPFHGEEDWCDRCGGYTESHNFGGSWESNADGHWKNCQDCEKSQTMVPHSFVELVDEKHLKSEATCVSVAVYYRSCSVCGHHATDTFESGDINPNNHDLVRREAKDPTCTEEGWTVHEACRREGCRYTTPHYRISHSGHSLIPHNGKTPTCTEKGWSAYDTCKRCDYTTYQELPIDPDNHDLEHHEGKAATCTEKGWSAYDTCKRCDYTTYEKVDALDHDWNDWTSNGNGTHTRTCKNDPGHTETEACSGVGCGQTGACSVCKGEYTAADHEYEPWSHNSNEHWSNCIYCSEERRSSHSFSEYEHSKATCASPAKYYKICSDCKYQIDPYDSGDIDPNNHDLIHHEAKAATCTEIGWKAYDTCSRCDYTTYVELTNGGHNLTHHAAKAPTCTEVGWEAYDACSRCDYTTYVELTNGGHSLTHHAAKAPTCTEVGWEAYDTCSRCDYTTYVELPALGHDYQAEVIPRTCEDDGYTLHTCTRCADRYADTIVPHCGHWYGEWTANGDGTQRAECLRGGCHHEKTVDCEIIELPALNISLCPVCGTVSDGSRLALTSASVKIISGRIPHGEPLLRVSTLANGEKLLTVGYVYGGTLSKASCQVKITLPAELVNGCTLSLLNADGTETAVDCTVDGDFAVFTLDFAQSQHDALLLRLIPVA